MKASSVHLIQLGFKRTTSWPATWTYASDKKRVTENGRRPVIKLLGVGTVARIPSSFDFPGPPMIQSQISKFTCFFSFVLFFLISFRISIGNFTVRCRLPTIMISILRNFYLEWKQHRRCKQQIWTGERLNGILKIQARSYRDIIDFQPPFNSSLSHPLNAITYFGKS